MSAQDLLDREWHFSIGGQSRPAPGGRQFAVEDPSTGRSVATAPDGDAESADEAVAAAKAAFPAWRATPISTRGELLHKLADLIDANAGVIAELDAICGGGIIRDMRRDVETASKSLRYFAGIAPQLLGDTIPASSHLHFTERVPFGVVVRIVAFNHPFLFSVAKSAAPLMAGNTVVIKPPESAPLSALYFAELAANILPAGVLNVVFGNGPEVPRALVRHPDVRRVGFIGSDTTGRLIQRDAAEVNVKSVTLELGGKNALIAFPDADPEAVAAASVRGMNLGWAGQSCGSTSRVLLHDDIADEVLDRIVSAVRELRVGPAIDERSDQGPLTSAAHLEKVVRNIENGLDEGASLLTGGKRPPALPEGHFVEPTVFDHVRPEMTIAREEIFGPVLSAIRWRDAQEAIHIANFVRYGLTASVFTKNIDAALSTSRALDAGFIWINGVAQHFSGVPYGGMKDSGIGRDESFEELVSYTQTQATTVYL